MFRQVKNKLFAMYKFMDYLFVSADNELALIERLVKEEEEKEAAAKMAP